jgi:hypothetical protein
MWLFFCGTVSVLYPLQQVWVCVQLLLALQAEAAAAAVDGADSSS